MLPFPAPLTSTVSIAPALRIHCESTLLGRVVCYKGVGANLSTLLDLCVICPAARVWGLHLTTVLAGRPSSEGEGAIPRYGRDSRKTRDGGSGSGPGEWIGGWDS